MINDIYFLKFNPESAPTKEKIIRVLSENWPLTAKEISKQLSKNYYSEITYQAVHKLIISMENEGVISRTGNSYQLNTNWISATRKIFTELEEKYAGTSGKYEFKHGDDKVVWKFSDYSVMSLNLAKLFLSKKLVGKADSVGIGIIRHGIFPIDFSFYDFDLMANMLRNNNGGLALIEKDTPFDKWIAKQYLKAGYLQVKTGVKDLELKNDIIVHGEYILEIVYSEETIEFLDKVFSKIKDVKGLYLHYLTNRKNNKLDITVTITRNPEMAKFIKKQMVEKYLDGSKL